ncbi:uncharacterized protein KIAA1958-like [Mytilus edulis]|uniref:uncharacterized protein KIAA1958-like n=1 Tax=Mytilus edulis TaxID=6550 RepID=UPI0039F0A3AB
MKNKNTKRKTASDVNIFTNWLSANNEHRKMEEIPVCELDKLLARFFMKVTKSDGTPYEPGTVKAFQSSISRYMNDKLNISIIRDKEFNHSREVLSAKMKELKTMGLGAKKKRADPFSTEEINLLYEKGQLGRGNPGALIHSVWLNNSLHFGLRSREEHATLRWGDIERKATSTGEKYLEHTERQTKTRTGATTHSRPFQAKMFEDKGNPRCPVATYLEYAKRRPEDMMEADGPFYLGINRDVKDGVWYRKQPMGKNTLSDFVKTMCEEAGVQGRKTNHSARKTTVTALAHEKIPPTQIMQISGHKNVQSINEYCSASLDQQQEMSHILSNVGSGGISKHLEQKKGTDQNNNIDDMPSDDDDQLLSASQEAELGLVLKDITNYESNDGKKPTEIPEIVHENYKDKTIQMFSGANITGNITINFSA